MVPVLKCGHYPWDLCECRYTALPNTAALANTSTAAETGRQPFPIRPLGDQLIIRLIQPDSVGSVILPDAAKRITHQGQDTYDTSQELQYVNRWLFEDMTETMKRIAAGLKVEKADKEALADLAARANQALLPKDAKGIIPENGAGLNFVEAEVMAVGPGRLAKDPELFFELVETLRRLVGWNAAPWPGLEDLRQLIERAERDSRIRMNVEIGQRIAYHPAVQRFDRQIDLGDGETYFIIREYSVLAILGDE